MSSERLKANVETGYDTFDRKDSLIKLGRGAWEASVFAFMGVNGTGKSTLTERLAQRIPGTGVVHASHELRSLFGGISREQQNKMSIDDRLGEIATHLTRVFDQGLNDNDRLLFDTQLLVPRDDTPRTYESAWSDEYTPYIESAMLIVAPPKSIRVWREVDEVRTGRHRDLSEENIARDQEANVDYFNALIARGALPQRSQILENKDGQLEQTEEFIVDHMMRH